MILRSRFLDARSVHVCLADTSVIVPSKAVIKDFVFCQTPAYYRFCLLSPSVHYLLCVKT